MNHVNSTGLMRTAITEMVKEYGSDKLKDYVGTSVAMIEANYCARQGLNRTNLAQ